MTLDSSTEEIKEIASTTAKSVMKFHEENQEQSATLERAGEGRGDEGRGIIITW